MFNKVLIANRGAIAVRIIRTLKRMGIKSVAVYAEADANSLHVAHADEAYSLGEGAAASTYLDQNKLFAIAQKSGAEAVHPGYGFLSENPEFVERCEKEGLVFIGPTPQQMRDFGLKHSARALAQQNNVPLLSGSDLLQSADDAVKIAATMTYPVILKSTAGGGGIGMQVCYDEKQLRQQFDSVKRLSANNFSNDGVFLEKYIERARHIEVQIFGDGKGKALALGERDCSAQRRHQKVIEETPAPNLSDAVRGNLHRVAEQLMSAVSYRNAGTVEFIYDQDAEQFYFLEVNTRLQVEHGVTEEIFGVDMVEWMLKQAAGELSDLDQLRTNIRPKGHAIQARIYAEDPHKQFQPCAGLLSAVSFPDAASVEEAILRIDHWLSLGLEVSPFFDPMLAKVIIHADNREKAIAQLDRVLNAIKLQGIETNREYVSAVLKTDAFQRGILHTRYLNDFFYIPSTIDVLSPGTMSTVQDYPGRVGYWDVGVPPSGPFDNLSFRLGNRLLGNNKDAAGLEITINGPTLKFNSDTTAVVTGADIDASLDGEVVNTWQVFQARAGQTLKIGKVKAAGARSYLLVAGGLDGNDYLGSKATFTLGQFGGFSGRALRTGDVLHLASTTSGDTATAKLEAAAIPHISNHWQLRVIYGPHGAPDFFTNKDIETFFAATWEVHYNSSRTGVRLIGPKPQWARDSGGEAGMHPSNIHDNAYAIGSIDFTGDMPVILGPDGPSLGGFVCPATVISADLWKLGQLKAGDKIEFIPVTQETAKHIEVIQNHSIEQLTQSEQVALPVLPLNTLSPIHLTIPEETFGIKIVYRPAGDKYLLVEYGPLVLDIRLRFRAHALMLWLQERIEKKELLGISELTPGIRSLQIHYDNHQLPLEQLIAVLQSAEKDLRNLDELEVPSRIVHLPLSWDDEACRLAIEKYMQSVRKDAPWCPSNIEFIRRINGLETIDDVKRIVFDASYVVMGLGDVYLGAPVATPLDPRHRLVTTKYNPARTWTAENSVGIGGSYMCIYGMEGPGGYQFVGRTLQMWNKLSHAKEGQTKEFSKPWLLRFFDQIRFYPVSAEELVEIRRQFPRGKFSLNIEETTFKLKDYQDFLAQNKDSIDKFLGKRDQAFAEELQRWVASGQINFESSSADVSQDQEAEALPDNCIALDSHVAGSLWQWKVKAGDTVKEGDVLCVLESMKMEIEVTAPEDGTVIKLLREQGQAISSGQQLLHLRIA